MKGRWASTPEPVAFGGLDGNGQPLLVRDPGRERDYVDIGPGSFEVLDVLWRKPSEETCRGWHNGIIGWSQVKSEEDFPLEKGRYHVKVRVQTGGRNFERVFRIENPQRREDFSLGELTKQPRLSPGL